MTPPSPDKKSDDTTIRTHIDEVSKRVDAGFRSSHARIGDVEKGLNSKIDAMNSTLRERIESRSQASGERFERHAKEDERRLGEIEASQKEGRDEARESIREVRTDMGKLDTKLDKLDANVQALALREAASTGKMAGVVVAATAAVGVVGWLLDHFVLPH